MTQIHSTQTSSKDQTATSVSPLDTQATAQNDISMAAFISNPYVKGASMREDVFSKQFTLVAEGDFEFPEDDPAYGTYLLTGVMEIATASSVTELVEKVSIMTVSDLIEIPCESEALDFYPHTVSILDRHGAFILGGKVRGETVSWVKPVSGHLEQEKVRKQIKDLHSEASFESGWDNYSTAKNLRQKAHILAFKLPISTIAKSDYFQIEINQLIA